MNFILGGILIMLGVHNLDRPITGIALILIGFYI